MTAARRSPSSVSGLRRGMASNFGPAMSAEDEIRNNAAELVSPPRRPRPEKPVRFTLDLDRAHHQFLKDYAVQAEARGAAEVMRALLDELRDDPELASRVRARIWQR